MMTRRITSVCALAALFISLETGSASAGFFGFGGDDRGKSGLDFSHGYDVNTVGTVTGRVTSQPRAGEGEQYLFEVRDGAETVSVSVGPGGFWEKKGIPIRVNDEISAKGAKAQGQDGKTYLLTQKIVNRTTGGQYELRSEKGDPLWAGRPVGGGRMRSEGQRFMGGGMMRGGGMMGGAGMRH